ncbi:hypothetical protein INT46_005344 [Mucor plumbeus]|uniref:Uncharacterized protein n=1 Tax=Mucor plumbeus TaxID=97098 RepID=A0A8H7UT52_9FUNG|nr:hypothetical protein INT46_005344 [Mucor plumbeus]
MSDPINTATAITTEAPVLDLPPKDTVNETAPINATTAATATGVNARGPKVTPIQRLSSVYNKAKQTVSSAVAEANKAINEKKTAKPTTTNKVADTADIAATAAHVSAAENTDPVQTTETATQDKKVGTSNIAFKDLLARVKGLTKPTPTHPTPGKSFLFKASTSNETAPPVPPKDNIKLNTTTNTNANPVIDQLKHNTTLLANYLIQKKKEFTKKSSPETHNEQHSTTPEVHDTTTVATTEGATTAPEGTATTSPLVRRITKLVHTATTTINKRKDQYTKKETHATETPAAAAATTETTATEPQVAVNTTVPAAATTVA